VFAPPLTYGPTLSWAGSGGEGEMDFAPEPFYAYAREALRCLYHIGFRRIYVLQFHQGSNGLQSLCLRRAAADLVREITSAWGGGWGRKPPDELPEKDIFGVFHIATLDTYSDPSPAGGCAMDLSHAGRGETQLILAVYPGLADMDAIARAGAGLARWLGNASEADEEEGRKWIEYCVAGWVRELSGTNINS
jgi:creatinine amidohydrolase/Fe(II)-dependent formamide hydrolase-like protein